MEKILIVEDVESLRDVLSAVLNCEGYKVTSAASAEEALTHLKTEDFTLILSDLKLPGKNGLEFLSETRGLNNSVPIVVMTAYGSIDTAVEAMKLGATDFITKPFDPSMLCNLVSQVIEHRRVIDRNLSGRSHPDRRFVTQNPEAEELLRHANKVAPLSSPVLILGESGTGKELIARMIHGLSLRKPHPFVAVNCGSMPSELLESEFFGHEAGAFTGATELRVGLFEVADHGTIFLDEIGNMPPNLQTKLLRVLQESEIKRLGANKLRKVDTRVLSATNCQINDQIKAGRFREDLYYRLGVVVLEIPPLRKRKEDIQLLANYFIKTFAQEFGEEPRGITPEALRLLESYDWPGNVRELENAIERAMVFFPGMLDVPCFQLGRDSGTPVVNSTRSLPLITQDAVKKAEIEAISRILAESRGNKSKAARALGISYKTLLNKVREYGLDGKH